MAGRRQDLETRIVAKDDASKVIDKVADHLDDLEKKDTTIDLKVDDKASDDIKELDRRLNGLSDEDKTIVLRAQAKDAQRDVDRLIKSLGQVDRMDDEEVRIRVEALGNARAELKAIEDQAERLDKEKVDVTVDVDNRASGKLSALRGEFDRAGGGLRGLATMATDTFGGIGAAAAAAGTAAAAAIGAFVKSAITDFRDLALEVDKASDALGIPAEQVSQLKEVAEDIGINFDAVKAAIGRMNRAAEGTPAAFANIGADIARGADGTIQVTDTFLQVVDALDRIPDAATRAAAGQQIFGKGWSQIASLIEEGADGVREAMRRVSDEKIIDEDEIVKAKLLRDRLDELSDSFEDTKLAAGELLIPALAEALNKLNSLLSLGAPAVSDTADAFGELGDSLPTDQVDEMMAAGIFDFQQMQAVAKIIRIQADAFGQLGDEVTDTELAASQATAEMDRLTERTADLYESSTEGAEGLDLLAEAQDRGREAAEAHIEALEEEAELAASMSENFRTLADINRDLAEARREQAELAKDEDATAQDRVDAAIKITDQQVAQFEAMRKAAGLTATATEKLDAQNKALLEQADALDGPAKDALLRYIGQLNGIPEKKMARVETLLDEGKVDQAERVIERLSQNREATVIFDADTSAADAERDRLGDPIYTDMIIQPRIGEVVARANGGPIDRDSLVRVGERGSELVALPSGSYVYPHGVTPPVATTGGSSQPVVINLHSHLHAAVIGSPHDVAQAVDEGMRRTARLMPRQP